MTPAALERATEAFRRGYRDAREGREHSPKAALGTFVYVDYNEGFLAYVAEAKYHGR